MALTDWLRSWWSKPELTVPPPPPEPPEAMELPPRESSPAQSRLMFREVVERQGAFPASAAIVLGIELCKRAVAFDSGPRRLRHVGPRSLFFTSEGGLGAPAALGLEALTPEEVRGVQTWESSDVFVASLVVFAAVSGVVRVFPGDSDFQILERVLNGTLPPLPANVPAGLRSVLDRGLATTPDARFPTLDALRAALEGLPHDPNALTRFLEPAWAGVAAEPAAEIPATTTETRLLASLRAGNENARAVYADFLESEGRGVEANWVRLEQQMRALSGDAQLEALTTLRALDVSREFMASVSRAELEACAVQFGFRCPRTWDALTPTAQPMVRWCGACREEVHFATTLEQAEQFTMRDRCFAVSATVARPDGPIGPAPGSYVGRGPPRALARKR